jgi:hypothetical protein
MGDIMIKCNIENCTKKADLIKEEFYYCASCYMALFMQGISTEKLKRRIEGQLRHNAIKTQS